MIPLRCLTLFLLSAASVGCGTVIEDPPPAEEESGTTAAVGSSTSNGSVSATSTTGLPPATSTTMVDPTMADDTTEDTGVVFLIDPDWGGCGAMGEQHWHCSWCDPSAQDCPEGEKCTPWANDGGDLWNSTRCSPEPEEPAAVGEACTVVGSQASGMDDCELGAMCWDVDPVTLQGTCAGFCNPYEVMPCPAGEVCFDDHPLEVYLCLPWCDPLDAGSCEPGQTCRDLRRDVVCVPNNVLPDGPTCNGDQPCGVDEACLGAEELAACGDVECCTPWCDLSAPDPDAPCTVPGEGCRPFYEGGAPIGFDHVGVCGLPV